MSDSDSSSSAPKLDSILATQTTPNTTSTTESATPAVAPAAVTTMTTAVTEPTAATVSPLREDLIKPAVSFLASPNVRSADKAKKIAFLQQKGLNQAEIDEAFKRAGDTAVTPSSNINTTTTATASYTPPAIQNKTTTLAPVLPSRTNVNYRPPQIVYVPQPPTPPMPVERVFAMAVIMGMSAVGLTAGVIGVLRHFIGPVFNRIAEYQRERYNQRKSIAEKLSKSIQSFHTENDDLDALIDQGEEKTVTDALVKQQTELSDKINRLVTLSKERLAVAVKKNTYADFRSELDTFRDVVTNKPENTYVGYGYNRQSNDSPAVSGLKSDIRSFKAVLLNRRNFPK